MRLTSTRAIVGALVLTACTQPDAKVSAPIRAPVRPNAVLGPGDATAVAGHASRAGQWCATDQPARSAGSSEKRRIPS
jgi:hypothetical protein